MSAQKYTDASTVWIGLSDREGMAGHPADCTCWKWQDGTPYGYHNFLAGEPNDYASGQELCVEAYLPPSGFAVGTWIDDICAAECPALCSIPDGLNTQTPSAGPTTNVTTSTPKTSTTPTPTPEPWI